MGFSSSTSKNTTKPIYEPQITGAYNTLSGVYNEQAPKVAGYADQLGSLVPSLMQKYQQGDPAINAAQGYVTETLGRTGGNPYLDDIISRTGANTAAGLKANMGTRGLTGGTAYAGVLAKALADNEAGLRYQDYNTQNALKAQAAGMAPGLAAGNMASIMPLLSVTGAAAGMPMDAASQYASGVGGLLGQYTNSTTKTSNPWGPALGNFISSMTSAFKGG